MAILGWGYGLDDDLKNKLLASIDANRLVLLCGAGLSMAAPSSLPSARAVAQACYDKHIANDPGCPIALRDDLEGLAEYFVARGQLPYFIMDVVPWGLFVRTPNAGHAAIADLLTTHAAFATLSTNYDGMIEDYARTRQSDIYVSLDGDAASQVHRHSPLLKFHGCATRERETTVWSQSQLANDPIATRIARTRTWLAANMREKDLVVVGFWSDWTYLNDVFSNAFTGTNPRRVIVVDPSPPAVLQAKAPVLWTIANGPGIEFTHVEVSGAHFLAELRLEFSRAYMRKMFASGVASLVNETGAPCDPAWLTADLTDNEDLYQRRCDCEGNPAPGPAVTKAPPAGGLLGLFHLLLRKAGATFIPGGYSLAGKSVRVVNGSNRLLSEVKGAYKEPPAIANAFDVVACVGAEDTPLPGHVFRPGKTGHILHPAAGGNWLAYAHARTELRI